MDYPIDIKKILYGEKYPLYPYDCCTMTSGYFRSQSNTPSTPIAGGITMDSTIIKLDNDIITWDNT